MRQGFVKDKSVHPLMVDPARLSSKTDFTSNYAVSDPVYLSDFNDDLGLTKGTAVVFDKIAPYSMGNEAFDGFLVIEIPSDVAKTAPVQFESTKQSFYSYSQKKYTINSKEQWVKKILELNTKLTFDSFLASQSIDFPLLSLQDNRWSDMAKTTLEPRLIDALGQLRKQSTSKYVEISKDSSGKLYLAVHSGIGNFSVDYLSLLNRILMQEKDKKNLNKLSRYDISYLMVMLTENSSEFLKIAWLNDISRRFAAINRLILAQLFLGEHSKACRIIFHKEHAFIEKCSSGYLHANSINATSKSNEYCFMTGPTNYLFKSTEKLCKHKFYPHRADPSLDIVPDSEHGSIIDIMERKGFAKNIVELTPVLTYKESV